MFIGDTPMELSCFCRAAGFTLPLQSSELVDFRPVTQDDRKSIQSGMSALSSRSRLFRFFTPIPKLPDKLLDYLTVVDQHHHVAWIAISHDQAQRPGLGIARFIRSQEQPTVAEFAVVVIDSYQRQGVGTILMAVLYLIAKTNGIEILRACVLPENNVMLNWLGKIGAAGMYADGVHRMDIPVRDNLSCLPNTPSARRLSHYINYIEGLG